MIFRNSVEPQKASYQAAGGWKFSLASVFWILNSDKGL
jgi:hypothetical protein